jgi:DNA polymerase-3 subunit gamma/tau
LLIDNCELNNCQLNSILQQMENFVVSARKYRPTGFDEVVGQEHITTTLKNAIDNNKLAQALLFCGPRGVGKTTCARIVARLINGFEEKAETNSLNIFELDAASNNSVEDIRNLIDQVRYPPQFGKFKVYIIDEVHMLSNAAFNAFLKTLEEPPSYAIFILATTEKHKVIPTILSRCQIFDFNRIQISDIAKHLGVIAKHEKIKVEEEAMHLIAQKADGALRDALSIFDLMVTYSAGKPITFKNVLANLHILDYDYYFDVVDGLLSQNHSQPLVLFDEVLRKGFDGHNFIVGLSEHLRNLLVSQDARTTELMEVPDSVRKKYAQQAQAASPSLLLSWLNIAGQADINYKASKNQRLLVELALMKMAHVQAALEPGQLVTAETSSAVKKKVIA